MGACCRKDEGHGDEDGRLLAEGRFKVVPLTPERLKTVSGIEQIPENWRRF